MACDDRTAARRSLMEEVATVLDPGTSRQDDAYVRLFATNALPMWVYDVDTLEILDANEAAQAVYGYSHAEFTRLTLRDLRPVEDVPKFLELIRQLPHFDRTGPWRHLKADGSIAQVMITSQAFNFGPRKARLVIVEDPDETPL